MQIHVTTADGTPYYAQVVSQVKFLVASGRLEPGQQLPPVRKLAEQLTLNPNTIARAYRELEAEGVVTSKRGSGVFVARGTSPLSKREKTRILTERIDALLATSRQMRVDIESLLKLVKERDKTMGEAS